MGSYGIPPMVNAVYDGSQCARGVEGLPDMSYTGMCRGIG